jgi:energy-coupling factor transporter ATP-binding protein EcfA2
MPITHQKPLSPNASKPRVPGRPPVAKAPPKVPIARIATEEELVHPRILLIGPSGNGKSYLLGMLNELYIQAGTNGIYTFDCDKGYMTWRNAGFSVPFNVYVDKDPRKPNAWDDLNNDIEAFEEAPHGYGAIGIDSEKTLQAMMLTYIIKYNELEGRRRQKYWALTTENDFGVLAGVIRQFFPQFINISAHMGLVMTMHTTLMKEEDTGRLVQLPAVTGKIMQSVGGYFDEMWYVKVSGYGNSMKRVVQVHSSPEITCKTRITGLKSELSFEDAVRAIRDNYGIKPGALLLQDITKDKDKNDNDNANDEVNNDEVNDEKDIPSTS